MSNGMNKVILMGNVGNEPLVRGEGDRAYLRLRLATPRPVKTDEGGWREETDWHTVKLWGNRATGLARVLVKGQKLLVEGRLKTEEYVKDGVPRWDTSVHATQVSFAGARPADRAHVAGPPEEGYRNRPMRRTQPSA